MAQPEGSSQAKMSSREVDIGSSSANPNKEMTKKTNHESDNVNDGGVSFLLEEPRSSLKKGFNIEVRSVHTVSPLQTQIAGHGSENDGQRYFVKFPVKQQIMYFKGDFSSIFC